MYLIQVKVKVKKNIVKLHVQEKDAGIYERRYQHGGIFICKIELYCALVFMACRGLGFGLLEDALARMVKIIK